MVEIRSTIPSTTGRNRSLPVDLLPHCCLTIWIEVRVRSALKIGPERNERSEAYGLTLDPEGWVSVRDLISALSRKHPE